MKPWRLFLVVIWCSCWLPAAPLAAQKLPLTREQYQQDFDFLWTTVQTDYCYFAKKQTDWQQVRAFYRPQLDTLSSRRAFVGLLEKVLAELYDNHAGLRTNRPDSRRLVPSATDIWAEFVNGQAVVQAVRPGFGAERSGVRPGMVVAAVDGVSLEEALKPWLPRALRHSDAAARNFALLQLLAGNHISPRTWSLLADGRPFTARPDASGMQLERISFPARLEARRIGNLGYLKINNSLGDNGLIASFDSALTAMQGTQGLILDLRETPSGGNTTVARAIMGRFISSEAPYQRHELGSEEYRTGIRRSWLELVAPRGTRYAAPLVVLAGRWTGSMGEGLTIGFDALRRATIVGTEMAQLNGSIYSYTLPHSGIGFTIPAERIFHVTGQPRENFRPAVYVEPTPPVKGRPAVVDPALQVAVDVLKRKK